MAKHSGYLQSKEMFDLKYNILYISAVFNDVDG
jgi:hypothetical protein